MHTTTAIAAIPQAAAVKAVRRTAFTPSARKKSPRKARKPATPIFFPPVPHRFPFSRKPPATRVRRVGDGYDVWLADGSVVWKSDKFVRPFAAREGVAVPVAAWALAVRENYTRDLKAGNYWDLAADTRRLQATVHRFLADHPHGCRCGVCDLFAAMDATDPGREAGRRVLRLAAELFTLLYECERAFGAVNTHPDTAGAWQRIERTRP